MKVDTIQTSFTSGEIAPEVYGRSDTAQYANACEVVENWLVRPYGSLISCAGTEYINPCKTGGSTSIVRVIPFIFSRADAYTIEMGVGYFRFFTDGAVVVSTGTTPYEVAHTYSASEIPNIHFRQLNDVVWLFHGNHPQRRLIRTSSANWELEDFAVIGGPFLDFNLDENIEIKVSGTGGTVDITVSPTNSNLFVVSGATLGHKNTYWAIGSSIAVTDETTGLDVQGYVKLTSITNSYAATGTVIKTLASTKGTTTWAEGAWSAVNGYPARGTFHQQRLIVARTDQEPNKEWGSKPFVYDDFAVNSGADNDAINIQIASAESNDIQWLASTQGLIGGTYGGDYSTEGGSSREALTPANTNVTRETGWGSEPVMPQKIGNYLYYIQRFAKKLREMFYSFDLDAQRSVDITILASHISGEGGFKEIAYQQNPDNILWCVCSNGTLATLTREIDQKVQGWSRQTTDGVYESVCSIPSQSEAHDEVWVVVKRTINGSDVRYIERFKSQIVPQRQDMCFYVHSGLSYNAYTAYTSTTISLSATAGTSVVVSSSAAHFEANDVGQRLRCINAAGATIGEMKVTNYTSSTIISGDVKFSFDASAYTAGEWGVSASTFSGLEHLEAKEVTVLGDGGLDKPIKTVSSGTITTSYNYFVLHAGLPYTQIVQTLVQEKAARRGTAIGKIQKVNQVGFKVNRSYKGFTVGGNATLQDRIVFRDPTTLMGTPEALYTGVIPNIIFRDDYRYGSKVRIQNPDPLPIELLNIMTSLDTNEK